MRKPSALRGKSRRSPTQSPRAALSAHMAFPVRKEPLARPSRKQPLRAPRRVLILAAVHETVVQPERAVAPEFDLERRHAKAAPVRRAVHFRERIFRRLLRLFHPRVEQRKRILARPYATVVNRSADLAHGASA